MELIKVLFEVTFGTVLWRGSSALSEYMCFMAAHVLNYNSMYSISTEMQEESDVYSWDECIWDLLDLNTYIYGLILEF